MSQPPIVIVSGRHRPHELLALWTSVPLGVGILATLPAPQSLAAVMPAWVVGLWAVVLAGSGVLGIGAMLWRGDRLRALRVETAAWILNAGVLGAFAGAAFIVAGQRAWFAGGWLASGAAANLWRAVQITRQTGALSKEPPQ